MCNSINGVDDADIDDGGDDIWFLVVVVTVAVMLRSVMVTMVVIMIVLGDGCMVFADGDGGSDYDGVW